MFRLREHEIDVAAPGKSGQVVEVQGAYDHAVIWQGRLQIVGDAGPLATGRVKVAEGENTDGQGPHGLVCREGRRWAGQCDENNEDTYPRRNGTRHKEA
jgi:hypothetical protein